MAGGNRDFGLCSHRHCLDYTITTKNHRIIRLEKTSTIIKSNCQARGASEVDGNHNDLSYYTLQEKTPVDILMLNEIPLL